MNYLAIKYLHIACAALSGSLFLLRGVWMLRDSAMLNQRWVKTLPHVIDTALLASALIMVFRSHQYPLAEGWLTAKLIALIAYIGLGAVALKRGKSKATRTGALIAALLVFLYIVMVALTRRAMVFG